MKKELNNLMITFYYNSYLDSSVFKTVSRLSDQLKEVIYFKLEDLKEDQTIGDIVPITKSDDHYLKELNYELSSESEVENVIRQINHDVFGPSLVDVPNSNTHFSIKITCHIGNRIENDIDFS
jgi:hypothetical protein